MDEEGRSGRPDEHSRLDGLARVTFAVEAPVRRLVGSGRLNPLPHAGTISVVLFFIVFPSYYEERILKIGSTPKVYRLRAVTFQPPPRP